MNTSRLDLLLVERKLVQSRAEAQQLIATGQVLCDGKVRRKPSYPCSWNAKLRVLRPRKYVSRGGVKLAAALKECNLTVVQKVCADVGASTGGFTDCLLQAGAARIYAIDVGRGQLSCKLRQDPRVVSMEKTNARYLTALPEPCDLVVMDVSFISITHLLPKIRRWLADRAAVLALVKPQFELGPGATNQSGVIEKEELRQAALVKVLNHAIALGYRPLQSVRSCLLGPAGNQEYFLHLGWHQGIERTAEELLSHSFASDTQHKNPGIARSY
ncbi:MAG: TlyA family RNA methyltransferase [Anaerolineaceae bacterium]|nr:TlyA family RNA methyltransferase [Anaerolineaceae bacterium]